MFQALWTSFINIFPVFLDMYGCKSTPQQYEGERALLNKELIMISINSLGNFAVFLDPCIQTHHRFSNMMNFEEPLSLIQEIDLRKLKILHGISLFF